MDNRKKEKPEKENKIERRNSQQLAENKPKKEYDERINGKVKENENEVTVENEDKKNISSLPKDEVKQEKSPVKRRESVVQRPGSARPGSRKLTQGKGKECDEKTVSFNTTSIILKIIFGLKITS